jgi:nicotinic acid mononucleotide adenylyltransferase
MTYISSHQLAFMQRVQKMLDHLQPEAPSEALAIPGTEPPHENVIVFTGSFNPPTNAHIALLKQAQRYARAHPHMHLYAAFSKRTVDKEGVERPLLLDRIVLLQQVLKKRLPHAGILLFNRGLYTEQAEAIRHSFPQVKRILFLLGYDKIVQIFDPRYYKDRDAALEDLFSQAEILVVPRGRGGEQELMDLIYQPENERFARYIHVQPFNTQYRDISSTLVRQGGSHYELDIPQEVREFMRQTRAYAEPLKLAGGGEKDYYRERIAALQHLLSQNSETALTKRSSPCTSHHPEH